MKIFTGIIIFLIGTIVGGLLFHQFTDDSSKYLSGKAHTPESQPFNINPLPLFYTNIAQPKGVKRVIGLPEAITMEDAYQNFSGKIPFRFKDWDNVVKPGFLRGFGFDSREILNVISQSTGGSSIVCDSIYVAFGVKREPSTNDFTITTIIEGLKNGDKQAMAVDYANPCPPYCPK